MSDAGGSSFRLSYCENNEIRASGVSQSVPPGKYCWHGYKLDRQARPLRDRRAALEIPEFAMAA